MTTPRTDTPGAPMEPAAGRGTQPDTGPGAPRVDPGPGHDPGAGGRPRWPRDTRIRDAAAVASFAGLAFWITARLWLHPTHGLRANRMDQALFEWMLANGARVVSRLTYPFVSHQMNVPDGVNLMANTSVFAISIPMAPVTLLLGPHRAFTVTLTLALIATAVAWYAVLSRYLVSSRLAAWVGALFCGFGPSMVAHAGGHPNIVAQFVVPLIIWRTLRLRRSRRWLRDGVLLGLLVVWQAFINLEILLMTAVGLFLFVAVLAGLRADQRRDLGPFAAGLGVAAAVAVALLGYPLYVQFFGPNSYRGLPASILGYGTDLASFVAFPRESLAGSAGPAERLAQNPSEENAFFGWPLVVLLAALAWSLRRTAAAIGLVVAGLVFAVLSLGPRVHVDGRNTHLPSVWAVANDVPILDSVVPTRWALAATPVAGLLLALGVDRAVALAREHPAAARSIRLATLTALAMALVPLVPTPLPSAPLGATPDFVRSGAWRSYVDGGRTVVPVPLPDAHYSDPLRWSAETGLDLRIPRGYFLGPNGRPDRAGRFSAPARPTSDLFAVIRRTGRMPQITARSRQQALADLRYWRAGVVVLDPHRYGDQFRRATTELTGVPPVRIGGVWVWDVRALAG